MTSCALLSLEADFRPVGNEIVERVRIHSPLLGERARVRAGVHLFRWICGTKVKLSRPHPAPLPRGEGATEASVAQNQRTRNQPSKTPMRATKHR